MALLREDVIYIGSTSGEGAQPQYLPFIVFHRRLTAYAHIDGVRNSLQIMSRHSSLPDHADRAIEVLENEYDAYRSEFHQFFPEIIKFCETKRDAV